MGDDFWGEGPDDEGIPEADRDLIDDPEALRRAEEAVAHAVDAPEAWVPTDTVWVPVAKAQASGAWTLTTVHDVLEGEGIPARYDPHDPRDAISLPYGLPREFAVVVPQRQEAAAARIVSDLADPGAGWSPAPSSAPAAPGRVFGTEAYVGVGSNLGDRIGTVTAALEAIEDLPGVYVLDVSHVYESEPWGVTDQPRFANAVARLDVRGEADAIVAALKEIEERLGRVPAEPNGPRAIDLDLLLFGDEEWDSETLTLPHPRLLERDFVVTPLLEVSPDIALPDGTPVVRDLANAGRVVADLGPMPGFGGPQRG